MTQANQSWFTLPVLSLILLSFILGTSEFVIVGILPDIASGINVSLTMAGNLISVFALSYAIGTPLMAAFISPYNRYYLLLGMTIIFILGNVLCGLAPDYLVLVIARIITAVISGTILSVSMTFSADVSTPVNQPKVISWIFSGFSIAAVFGVPLGTIISQSINWRATFLILSVVSVIILFMLWHYLPNVGRGQKSNLLHQFGLLKSTRIQLGMLIVVIGAAATYVFYTYMTPLMQNYLHLSPASISIVLSAFGVGTIISNIISGRLAGLGGMRKMPYAYLLQAIFLALMTFTSYTTILGLINIFIIGVLMYLQNSPTQLHFLRTAKRERPTAIAFASSLTPVAFNIGITLGSACGGVIISTVDMPYIGIGGAIFALVAVLLNIKLLKVMSSFSKRQNPMHN